MEGPLQNIPLARRNKALVLLALRQITTAKEKSAFGRFGTLLKYARMIKWVDRDLSICLFNTNRSILTVDLKTHPIK